MQVHDTLDIVRTDTNKTDTNKKWEMIYRCSDLQNVEGVSRALYSIYYHIAIWICNNKRKRESFSITEQNNWNYGTGKWE